MNPAISLEQANAILDTVIEAGIFEPPKPTEDDAIIKSAGEVIVQAETAKRSGVKAPAVIKVLDLASPLQNIPEYDSIEDTEPATATLEEFIAADPKGTAKGTMDDPPFDPPYVTNNVSSEDTAASSTHAKLLERDGEKESSHYTPDIPELPRDFSQVSDRELRSLHAIRYGVLSKVIHELGLEESDYQSAQINYDQEFRKAKTNHPDLKAHDKVDAAVVDTETWRKRVDEHHQKVIMLRSYKELLQEEIKGLSREYTMREGERVAIP